MIKLKDMLKVITPNYKVTPATEALNDKNNLKLIQTEISSLEDSIKIQQDFNDERTFLSESEAKGRVERFLRGYNYSTFFLSKVYFELFAYKLLNLNNKIRTFNFKKYFRDLFKKHRLDISIPIFPELSDFKYLNVSSNNKSFHFSTVFFASNNLYGNSSKKYSYSKVIKGLDEEIDPENFNFEDFKLLSNYSSTLGLTNIQLKNEWAKPFSFDISHLPLLIEKHALVRMVQRTNASNNSIFNAFNDIYSGWLLTQSSAFEGCKIIIPSKLGIFLGSYECVDDNDASTLSFKFNNIGLEISSNKKFNTTIANIMRIKTFIPYKYCTRLQYIMAMLLTKCISEFLDSTPEEAKKYIEITKKFIPAINFSEKFLFNSEFFGTGEDYDFIDIEKLSINELHEILQDELKD